MNILVHLPQTAFLPIENWDWPGVLVSDPTIAEALVIDPNATLMKEQLDLYPELRVIVTASTGTNHIDLEACRERYITVLSLLDDRGGLDEIKASSEFTFLLLLATLKNLKPALQEVAVGRWKQNERLFRGHELYNKDVGIIGLGRIGKNIFKWLKSFGANVKYIYDPERVEGGDLGRLFEESDIVVVCCSLTPETEGMIGYDLLSRLKEGAVLVNTARGEVMVEADLLRILLERSDLRVGIDVLSGEVHGTHLASSLLCLNNVTITPHMAGVTVESQHKATLLALKLLVDYTKQNSYVNKDT